MAELSKKQQRALKRAQKDGRLSAGEARQLAELGISRDQTLATGLKVGPNNAKILDPGGKYKTKEDRRKEARKEDKQNEKTFTISKKDRNLLLQDINRLTNTQGKPYGKGDNRQVDSWNLETAIREGSNADLWKKVAKKGAGVNFNSTSDIAKMISWVQGSTSTGGGSSNNNDPTGAPRDTGKYEDILAAQNEDRVAGQETAKRLAELQSKLGGISPEVQAQLDSLTLANTGLTNDLISQGKAGERALKKTNKEWSGKLKDQSKEYQGMLDALSISYEQKLADASDASTAAITRLEEMMMQQQLSALATQNLLTSQLQSSQTALANQQRMSANLASAYVPQAEATAQSVLYGDSRNQRRKPKNNSLSDLSIVSGVTSSNSTSGLQVAG